MSFYFFKYKWLYWFIQFDYLIAAARTGSLTEKGKEEELKGAEEREKAIDATVTFNSYSWTSNDTN